LFRQRLADHPLDRLIPLGDRRAIALRPHVERGGLEVAHRDRVARVGESEGELKIGIHDRVIPSPSRTNASFFMRRYYRVTVTLYDTPLLDGAVVDRARPFIADALTPLYYTRIWRELTGEQRLTYNQLNGIYWNELIAAFERHLALALLSSEVAPRVRELTREEILHEGVFHDLNRLAGAPRRFISIPAIASATLRGLARTRSGAA